jgi:hypothetical protein
MSPQRWLLFVFSIAVGIGLGLYYGRVISPVEYVDTTPATLRVDFRADYTLMVAETFQSEQNLENAARHLAILGSQPPTEIITEALNFARQNGFAPTDIATLQDLNVAMQGWQPGAAEQQAVPTSTVLSPGSQP